MQQPIEPNQWHTVVGAAALVLQLLPRFTEQLQNLEGVVQALGSSLQEIRSNGTAQRTMLFTEQLQLVQQQQLLLQQRIAMLETQPFPVPSVANQAPPPLPVSSATPAKPVAKPVPSSVTVAPPSGVPVAKASLPSAPMQPVPTYEELMCFIRETLQKSPGQRAGLPPLLAEIRARFDERNLQAMGFVKPFRKHFESHPVFGFHVENGGEIYLRNQSVNTTACPVTPSAPAAQVAPNGAAPNQPATNEKKLTKACRVASTDFISSLPHQQATVRELCQHLHQKMGPGFVEFLNLFHTKSGGGILEFFQSRNYLLVSPDGFIKLAPTPTAPVATPAPIPPPTASVETTAAGPAHGAAEEPTVPSQSDAEELPLPSALPSPFATMEGAPLPAPENSAVE